ncbi:hypothetical protein FRB99_001900 [Tulasnella sp. 403]|nr:hypothetical protein FRB99_001900 [Tulasnella sp. 403]
MQHGVGLRILSNSSVFRSSISRIIAAGQPFLRYPSASAPLLNPTPSLGKLCYSTARSKKHGVAREASELPVSEVEDSREVISTGKWLTSRSVLVKKVPLGVTESRMRDYLTKDCGLNAEISLKFVQSQEDAGKTQWVFLDLPTPHDAWVAKLTIYRTPFKGNTLYTSYSLTDSRLPTPNPPLNCIYVQNVGDDITPREFESRVKEFKGLEKIHYGTPNGRLSAFLEFQTVEEATRAKQSLNGAIFTFSNGKQTPPIRCEFAKNTITKIEPKMKRIRRTDVPLGDTSQSSVVPTNALFVGNLPNSISREQFIGLFKDAPGFRKVALRTFSPSDNPSLY